MTEPCRNECGNRELFYELQTRGHGTEDEWRKTIPEINYKDITFSDGLILHVPYEKDGRVHDCPAVTEVNVWFDDPGVPQYGEELMDQNGDLWEDLNFDHMSEFFWKDGRDNLRTRMVNGLNRFFHYSFSYDLRKLVEFLPTQQFQWIKAFDDDGEIYPLQLLAFFYELDGYYADAKRCLEIQLKIGPKKIIKITSKLDGKKMIHHDLHTETLKQIDFYNNEIERIENEDSSNPIDEPQSIFDEIVDGFENGTLKEFIETIFTSEELKQILKEIPEFRKRTKQGWMDSETSLLDKSRKFQSKEEKNDLNIDDPRDIDHLSFGDKVLILDRKMYGKRFDGEKTGLKPEQQEQNLLR